MSIVDLKRVSKSFADGTIAVDSVDLTVSPGEMLVVLGPSGSGKSTLLRLIAGLDSPGSGRVEIDGRDVDGMPPSSRDVAMVFQNQVPYPHLDVFENLAFGLRARRHPREEIAGRVEEVAAMLGLSGKLKRRPATLSGGEKQRVSLGRALARRPKVLLLDEPFSNLDTPLRASLREEFLAAHRRFGTTTLLVTHDQAEAMALGDRVAVMDRGKIAQVGTPREIYDRPANRFVAGFVGDPPMNLLDLEVFEAHVKILGEGSDFKADRGLLLLGVRPENVSIGGDPADAFLRFPGVVHRVEDQGFDRIVRLRAGARSGRAHLLAARGSRGRLARGLDQSGPSGLVRRPHRRAGRLIRPGDEPSGSARVCRSHKNDRRQESGPMGSEYTGPLEQVGPCQWKIPKSYREDMRVDGLIFADEKLIGQIKKDQGPEQVANVATLPGIQKASLAMPDIHWGYGFAIGGVAATDPEEGGVISPGGVGYDINCGVRLVRTNLEWDDVKPRIRDLVNQLFRDIPTGVGQSGNYKFDKPKLAHLMEMGSKYVVDQGYGSDRDLTFTEAGGRLDGADPDRVSDRAYTRGFDQCGTLGSGNHFLEVQVVDRILDETAAEVMGLREGQITVLIHSGSRGLGYQVCEDNLAAFAGAPKRYGFTLPDKQLACARSAAPRARRILRP